LPGTTSGYIIDSIKEEEIMKKIIVIETALALCLALGLGACGGGGGGKEDAPPDQPDTVDGVDEVTPDPVAEDVPADDQPAEEQPEIVEDPQPDEVVEDPVEDTPVDTPTDGDAPTGACTNSSDMAIIENPDIDVQGQTTTCGMGCLSDPDRRTCTVNCVVDATGLSAACADCYAGMAACAMEHCIAQCAANPDSPGCRSCLEDAGCVDDFLTCSGLPPE
jgi:hypothetical protein